MEKHPLFPFQFKDWEDAGIVERIMFHDVTFLEDFGAFKIGEHVTTIEVGYDMGVLQTLDEQGNVIKKTGFRAVPSEIIAEEALLIDHGGSD